MKVYLAGPLFSAAERDFNLGFAEELRRLGGCEVVLPQLRAQELLERPDFAERMYEACLSMINECDCIVAVLEGPDVDSGTCIEIGYGLAKGKPIVGIRSDPRGSEDRGVNLMVSGSCSAFISAPMASLAQLADETAVKLSRLKQRSA